MKYNATLIMDYRGGRKSVDDDCVMCVYMRGMMEHASILSNMTF